MNGNIQRREENKGKCIAKQSLYHIPHPLCMGKWKCLRGFFYKKSLAHFNAAIFAVCRTIQGVILSLFCYNSPFLMIVSIRQRKLCETIRRPLDKLNRSSSICGGGGEGGGGINIPGLIPVWDSDRKC